MKLWETERSVMHQNSFRRFCQLGFSFLEHFPRAMIEPFSLAFCAAFTTAGIPAFFLPCLSKQSFTKQTAKS
jgi:hypothetical protein